MLFRSGVSVVVMTGDNQYVTQKVARDVGLPADLIVTGNQVDQMDDAALGVHAERNAIFARVSPTQKNRIILALKARGHVVGYIGDGINDAPSFNSGPSPRRLREPLMSNVRHREYPLERQSEPHSTTRG